MKQVIEIILGLLLLIAVVWCGMFSVAKGWGWLEATLSFIKGGIVVMVVLIGLLLIFLGFSELRA